MVLSKRTFPFSIFFFARLIKPKGIPFLYSKEDIEKILWVYGADYIKSSLSKKY